MNIVEKPHLRQQAVNYINYVLNNGKTLSHCMLKNCNLDIGRIVSYLPTESKADSLLAKIIQSYLQEKIQTFVSWKIQQQILMPLV